MYDGGVDKSKQASVGTERIAAIHSWTKVLAPLRFWNFKSFRTPSVLIAP